MAGYGILAGQGFLPSLPQEHEGRMKTLCEFVDDLVVKLAERGLLFNGELLEGDEYRRKYAVTDEALRLFGIDIHEMTIWHAGGEEVRFGDEPALSKLVIIFEDTLDHPPDFFEKVAAFFRDYLKLDDPPVFTYVLHP